MPSRSSTERLPTFLVIGAMKAGTTSLYHHLASHPDVFLSPVKEPNFFSEPQIFAEGLRVYARLFRGAGDAIAVGEASTSYSRSGAYPDVPARIRAALPDARLVYLLRDPLARMCSMYRHEVLARRESAPIDDALLDDPRYLDASRYARQVETYLEHFPRERMCLVLAEDLSRNPNETVRTVSTFLGVNSDRFPVADGAHRYVTADRRSETTASSLLRRTPIVPWARRRLPEPVRARVLRCLTAAAAPTDQTLSMEAAARIRDRLRPDLVALGSYMGEGFTAWGLLTSPGGSTSTC